MGTDHFSLSSVYVQKMYERKQLRTRRCQIWHETLTIKDMKIRNFTNHDIIVLNEDSKITIKSEGIARVSQMATAVTTIEIDSGSKHIPPLPVKLSTIQDGIIEGLPEEVEGTLCIVSAKVVDANSLMENPRHDLIAPYTFGKVGNFQNQLGCMGFKKVKLDK